MTHPLPDTYLPPYKRHACHNRNAKKDKGLVVGGLCATSHNPGHLADSVRAAPSHVMIWSRCIAFGFDVRKFIFFHCVRPLSVVYVVMSLPACVY